MRLVFIVAITFLILTICHDMLRPPNAMAQTGTSGVTPGAEAGFSGKTVHLDFNNVDIHLLIKFISELSQQNFVVDRRVKGKVTIISPTKISIAEAYKVFESVLEIHGFTTLKAGKIVKIIPSPDARSKSIETRIRQESYSPRDRVITQVISLRYADANEVKRLFTPLVSKSSVILAYAPTNILIVTDVQSNISRLLRILKTIDITGIGQELSVIPIENADAAQLAKMLTSVFRSQAKPQKGQTQKVVQFVADERTNTLVVLAGSADTLKIKELIDLLDRETPRGSGKIHVYYLENATAEELAKVLQALPQKSSGATKDGKAPVISGEVNITADKATNSLIIMAPKEDYLVLEQVIKQLDIPRAMVYIEALIMEVNVEKDLNLGVEWFAVGEGNIGGDAVGYGGGIGRGSTTSGMFTPGANSLPSFPTGFSLGIIGEGITVGGLTFPSISAFVNAVRKDKDVHILSTPQLLTTDNEEATITVGSNVPFQTQSAASDVSTTYNSFEYRDVGITLKVTPHVSKDRLVRLNVSQVVERLDVATTTSVDRPTTLKRSIETTIIVRDKNIVVIGGLIDDSFSTTETKVPCLGDVPFLGRGFTSTEKGRNKSNLYVFLMPRVIENDAEAEAIFQRKKEHIDKIEEGLIKLYPEDLGGQEANIQLVP